MGSPASPRGTSNKNVTGSAADRRRRKQHLLDTFGDGTWCDCSFCGVVLDFGTVTVDRIIPGCLGGTYRRDNIRPACLSCNSIHGNTLQASRRAS
jgi:5-methylcytosine-specific restriction endonuclease McrA